MKKPFQFLIYFILSSFAAIQIFPLVWLATFSLKSNREIVTKSAFTLPERFLYQNYVDAWTKGNVQNYFFNSLIVGIVCLVFTLVLSSMVAYAVTRMRWKGSSFVLYLFLAGMMVPIHAALIPLFMILNRLGLLSSYLSIMLPYIGLGLPFGVFVFANFLRSLPMELESAAFIDGCDVKKSFFNIIVPVLKPAFATVGIFTFLANWNEFIMAATFLHNQKLRTLPLGLMAFQGEHSADWGPMGAAILIASIPIMIVYIFFSDKVEKSFAAGAILK